jgi:tetratricopeptide (TPR) repeat protein
MQEKIGLYEEILQQDQNARIFYPLARMYHEIGRSSDALSVLERGLARHPEHLAAMLLQVEILEGMDSDQEQSVAAGLIGHLAEAPALWRLWSRRSREQGQEDLAVALQFIARYAAGESLSWSGILSRGLEATGRMERHEDPDAAPETGGSMPPRGQGQDREPGVAMHPEGESSAPEAAREQSDAATRVQPAASIAEPEEQGGEMVVEESSRELLGIPEPETEDDGSPKTRTMADLLAEQGEHERALAIYSELWRAAPPGDERKALESLRRAMMEELDRREKGRISSRRKSEKEELLSVLDGLAKRLEARTAQ